MGRGDHAHHGAAPPAREQTAGSYRVRLAFHAPGQGGDHAQHEHARGQALAPGGHLVVLVNDLATGEPVPYLPISATIHADKAAPRTVNLVPMMGSSGLPLRRRRHAGGGDDEDHGHHRQADDARDVVGERPVRSHRGGELRLAAVTSRCSPAGCI